MFRQISECFLGLSVLISTTAKALCAEREREMNVAQFCGIFQLLILGWQTVTSVLKTKIVVLYVTTTALFLALCEKT